MEDRIFEAIYDAPLDEDPFVSLARLLRRSLRLRGAMFSFACDGDGDGNDNEHVVFDAEGFDVARTWSLYTSTYRFIDPIRSRAMRAGNVFQLTGRITDVDLETERYYRDFCLPMGANHCLFAFLGEHRGMQAWLSLARNSSEGPFSSTDMALLSDILPHLQRTIRIYAELQLSRQASSALLGLFDAAGMGVALLNGQRHVLAANKTAKHLLSVKTSGAPSEFRSLPKFDNNASKFDRESTAKPYVRSLDRTDRRAVVIPLMQRNARPILQALLIATEMERAQIDANLVADIFGLTKSESRIVVELCHGRSLEDAAEKLGITISTARTYCKRAITKTGSSRQTELVVRVLTSAAAVCRQNTDTLQSGFDRNESSRNSHRA